MMLPLEKTLRNQLEATVKKAREMAETAARAVLEHLGVGEAQTLPHLKEHEKELRRQLRVHGRQLGDELDGKGGQALDRLVEEVAYEHWHRMLFARFLAENNLLMYPDPVDPVPVSLEECEDLAKDEGASNGWELAARYAARMLPQIFRLDSPVLKLQLSLEHQLGLERLVANLPTAVFAASDSLGWVYQFWQAKRKEEVNASEVKIGARELPAVTQLFTEPYMVSFLLDNSLGAWWAARRLSAKDLATATSEVELRQKASIPGVGLEYLRFIKVPAKGTSSSTVGASSTKNSLPPSPSGRGVGGEGEGEGGLIPAPKTNKTLLPATILNNARQLRTNQTDAEQLLWGILRDRRFANKKFRRQHPIGRYILDFYCQEEKLAVELDGSQHIEDGARRYDEKRSQFLKEQGIRVLRFWNNEMLQETEKVCEALWNELEESPCCEKSPSPPAPLPEGEGSKRDGADESKRDSAGQEVWEIAAGKFEGWPQKLSELKSLDPCCGSGHFLVAALLMLTPMRMELEGLSAREAVDAVLRDNLNGLELDQRCVELAAFALALTAWRYPDLPAPSKSTTTHNPLLPSPSGRGAGGEGDFHANSDPTNPTSIKPIGYRPLPELSVACSGLSVRWLRKNGRSWAWGRRT